MPDSSHLSIYAPDVESGSKFSLFQQTTILHLATFDETIEEMAERIDNPRLIVEFRKAKEIVGVRTDLALAQHFFRERWKV